MCLNNEPAAEQIVIGFDGNWPPDQARYRFRVTADMTYIPKGKNKQTCQTCIPYNVLHGIWHLGHWFEWISLWGLSSVWHLAIMMVSSRWVHGSYYLVFESEKKKWCKCSWFPPYDPCSATLSKMIQRIPVWMAYDRCIVSRLWFSCWQLSTDMSEKQTKASTACQLGSTDSLSKILNSLRHWVALTGLKKNQTPTGGNGTVPESGFQSDPHYY